MGKKEKDIDNRIRRMIRENSPEPSRNPWLERKVLNRLPPSIRPVFGLPEIVGMGIVIVAIILMINSEMQKLYNWDSVVEFDYSVLVCCLLSGLSVATYAVLTMLKKC